MGENLFDKIIKAHLVEGNPIPGERVGIKVDQTLTQDATGTMVYLEFETMHIPTVRTKLSVSYIDHNTMQDGFENADDHRYLQSTARKFGLYFSRPGNGICHQVQLERFGVPGDVLLGSDSHTPTNGGIGMMAIGVGGLDVATSLAGAPFYLDYPKVIRVVLKGELQPWVTAKDIILKVLEHLSTKGNVGCAIEYSGDGVKSLDVPARATITNMGAETGVTTSIFPSDENTLKFLKAQGREEVFKELKADPDAEYYKTIEIDLKELAPLAACPHSPGNIETISKLAGLKVDQVCIGSCTNASYQDLAMVAKILKGKTIDPRLSLIITPGSRQVLLMLAKSGELATLVAAGARIAECTCNFCIGAGFSPKSHGVSVRTNNRNFKGRSGTADADIYLVSPAIAAVTALTGEITDPTTSGDWEFARVDMPEKFLIDDSMIIPPASLEEREKIEIQRGPNIGEPPISEPLKDTIKGEVIIKVGDKITTDHIMPAGRRLKYRSNIPKYAEFVFEPVDETCPQCCLEHKEKGEDGIIVGGLSYGQGSSREHAAICPMYLGIKAVLAKSIERIHADNLVNFGILPLYFENESDYDTLEKGDKLTIAGIHEALKSNTDVKLQITNKQKELPLKFKLSERQKEILFSGGKLNYIKKQVS
ncbi:aconitate hydratase [bacterium]|nr:aconitate hydratase [bacterium]